MAGSGMVRVASDSGKMTIATAWRTGQTRASSWSFRARSAICCSRCRRSRGSACAARRCARDARRVAGWLEALAATSGVADAIASLDDADAARPLRRRRGSRPGSRTARSSTPGSARATPVVRARLRRVAARGSSCSRSSATTATEHAAAAYARQVGVSDARAALVSAAGRWRRTVAGATLLRALRAPDARGARGRRLAAPSAGRRRRSSEVVARWRARRRRRRRDRRSGGARRLAARACPSARDWPLPDVAALLAHVDAYVGNDSGISHLAGAAGARGVALFGPTAARRWRPLGGRIAAAPGRRAGRRPASRRSAVNAAALERAGVAAPAARGVRGILDKRPEPRITVRLVVVSVHNATSGPLAGDAENSRARASSKGRKHAREDVRSESPAPRLERDGAARRDRCSPANARERREQVAY